MNAQTKKCTHCGAEYSADLPKCLLDHTANHGHGTVSITSPKSKLVLHKQNAKRLVSRVAGIAVLLAAAIAFINGIRALETGDIQVGEYRRGGYVTSNVSLRVSAVLLLVGVVCVWRSFPCKGAGDENDKHST
jgi:hypothetical protein